MYYVGKNIVVAAVGLPHEEIVAYARAHLSHIPAEPPARLRNKLSPQIRSYEETAHKDPQACAKWQGGMELIEEMPRTVAVPPNYRPQSHIAIAFEGVSTHGDDMYLSIYPSSFIIFGSERSSCLKFFE